MIVVVGIVSNLPQCQLFQSYKSKKKNIFSIRSVYEKKDQYYYLKYNTLPASQDHVQQIWNLEKANKKKMKNNIKETIKGRFHSGNLCTGISSISRAFRRDPRSTGTNPIERINPLTSSLAEWTSPEYKTSLLPRKKIRKKILVRFEFII